MIEGRLAAYIWDCLGWQGLGLALPHFALAGDAKALVAGAGAAARPSFRLALSLTHRSNPPPRCLGAALKDSAAHGLPAEEDLFLARAAFQTAAAPGPAPAQLAMAQEVLRVYAEEREGGLPDTPLLHCVALMLEVRSLPPRLTTHAWRVAMQPAGLRKGMQPGTDLTPLPPWRDRRWSGGLVAWRSW